jgi:hypothetical protein
MFVPGPVGQLGNCGKVGTTYMGTVGNPMNLINIVIAENEEDSPFAPLSVRKGFKKNENIVSLFEGWGVLSAKNCDPSHCRTFGRRRNRNSGWQRKCCARRVLSCCRINAKLVGRFSSSLSEG